MVVIHVVPTFTPTGVLFSFSFIECHRYGIRQVSSAGTHVQPLVDTGG